MRLIFRKNRWLLCMGASLASLACIYYTTRRWICKLSKLTIFDRKFRGNRYDLEKKLIKMGYFVQIAHFVRWDLIWQYIVTCLWGENKKYYIKSWNFFKKLLTYRSDGGIILVQKRSRVRALTLTATRSGWYFHTITIGMLVSRGNCFRANFFMGVS